MGDYIQPELITPSMLNDFHIGWYYGYNPDKKPYKGTIMPICRLEKITETPIGVRCEIQIIGDGGTNIAYADELSNITFVNAPDLQNFSSGFLVEPDQMKIWEQSAK